MLAPGPHGHADAGADGDGLFGEALSLRDANKRET
jgi:hypothetical protein